MNLQLSLDAPKWLDARTIIFAPTSSYVYGTQTDNSDKVYGGLYTSWGAGCR